MKKWAFLIAASSLAVVAALRLRPRTHTQAALPLDPAVTAAPVAFDRTQIRAIHGVNEPTACDVAYLELQRKLVLHAACTKFSECTLIALPSVFETRRGALLDRWFDPRSPQEEQIDRFGIAMPGVTRGIRRDQLEGFKRTIASFERACPLTGSRAPEVDEAASPGCVEGLCVFATWMGEE